MCVVFKTTLLPLLNWFVITLFELWCVVKLCSVMNICNLWWRCLIMYDLGCMLVELRSSEVSSDYRVYMGSSPLAWLLSWSLIYLNSYKLDDFVTVRVLPIFKYTSATCYLHQKKLRQNPAWGRKPPIFPAKCFYSRLYFTQIIKRCIIIKTQKKILCLYIYIFA